MTRKNAETKRAARASKSDKGAAKPKSARARAKPKRSARAAADAGAANETQSEADATEQFLEAIGAPRIAGHSAEATASADLETDPETESAPRPEVDPTKLKPDDLRKRVAKVYQLERQVERARVAYDLSRRHFAGAKRALADAEEQLEQEIRDQRYGPGPLFTPDGQGAAASRSASSSSPAAPGVDDGLSSVENEFGD